MLVSKRGGTDESFSEPMPGREETPAQIKILAKIVNGCKDTLEGMNAKISLVLSFIQASCDGDLFDVLCWLHLEQSIKLDIIELLKVVEWKKPLSTGTAAVQDANNPGMFVASVLDTCSVADMPAVVDRFVSINQHVDGVDALRFVNKRGFLKVAAKSLLAQPVTNWKKPLPGGIEP